MIARCVYSKTCSGESLTTLDRIGASESYMEGKISQNLKCAYTIQSSETNVVPIPNPFIGNWAFGAFANEDFDDKSSISGTRSKHYTAQVLYQ